MGRKGLQQVARIAKPDTILGWYRKLVAAKFDGSKQRRSPGRPRISSEIEDLVVRLARENSGWGYDRIVGALANLGHQVSDQTVGNILRRQIGRNATFDQLGYLNNGRYVLHDRDAKFCAESGRRWQQVG